MCSQWKTRRAPARRKAGFFATLSDGRKPPCGGSGRLEQRRRPERNRAGTFLIFAPTLFGSLPLLTGGSNSHEQILEQRKRARRRRDLF